MIALPQRLCCKVIIHRINSSKPMSKEIDDFSETVSLIYEAGLDPEVWPHALQSMCRHVNASKAQILYIDPEDLYFSFACGYGFNPYTYDIGASRFRRYMQSDPVALYGIQHLNQVFADRRVIDETVIKQSPAQREIRDPANMEFLLTSFLSDSDLEWTGVCFMRGKESEAFSLDDEAIFSRFIPHIKRASFIHKSLASTSHLKTLQSSVLDNIEQGIIVVDELHDVVATNKKADEILDRSKGLHIKRKRLICANKKVGTLLFQNIEESLDNKQTGNRSRTAVRIIDELNNSIFLVTTPLQLQRFKENQQKLPDSTHYYTARIPVKSHVLITLCEADSTPKTSVNILIDLFGLTPAEAALTVELSSGDSLQQAAKTLGRTPGTARIQLQSIFEKTDTNRQSNLIRLLMSIP